VSATSGTSNIKQILNLLPPVKHFKKCLAFEGIRKLFFIFRFHYECEVECHLKYGLNLQSFPIYIQQVATLHRLFYVSTDIHVSGGTTTQHQESKQLYLQHLVFVTSLLLSAAIVEDLELV
jgi:hypothetical protein